LSGVGTSDLSPQLVFFISRSFLTSCALFRSFFFLCPVGPVSTLGHEIADRKEDLILSNGIVIHPSDFVWINIDGIHYNEDNFKNASAFLPERWLINDEKELQRMESCFLPFGAGTRACPGSQLAQLEILLAITFLSIYYDSFSLNCPVDEIKRIKNFANIANKMPIALVSNDKRWKK
jgi:cytochrome P450